MKVFTAMTVALASLAAVAPASALETMVSYDGFSSQLISPARWFGSMADEKLSMTETVRVIQPDATLGNRLQLMVRGYGLPDSNVGTASGSNRLRFANGSAVTSIGATIWVKEFLVTGNALNAEPTAVKARLAGFFFNTGGPVAGSAVNDVLAQVYVRRRSDSTDAANILEVKGLVMQCTDNNCNNGTTLGSASLGTVAAGTAIRLFLKWDKPNHRFIVQRSGTAAVNLPYVVADNLPPTLDNNKRLEVTYSAANSTAATRTKGYINAYFDSVSVNQSAAP